MASDLDLIGRDCPNFFHTDSRLQSFPQVTIPKIVARGYHALEMNPRDRASITEAVRAAVKSKSFQSNWTIVSCYTVIALLFEAFEDAVAFRMLLEGDAYFHAREDD